jgi:Ca2+-binding EF-hand superfamily protein
MTGEQIEAAKRRFEMEDDPVEESIKQEELVALYENFIGVHLQESRELLPDSDQELIKVYLEKDIIKLAEALKQGRI